MWVSKNKGNQTQKHLNNCPKKSQQAEQRLEISVSRFLTRKWTQKLGVLNGDQRVLQQR